MKKKIATLTLGMMIACGANAAGPQVPHVFEGGKKAIANEVNENFQELADRIDSLSQTVDGKANTTDVNNSVQSLSDRIDALPGGTPLLNSVYRIADSVLAKNFQISFTGNACNQETRSYQRSTPGGIPTLSETVVVSDGATPCSRQIRTFERTNTGTRLTKIELFSPDGATLNQTNTFTGGLLIRPDQMFVGIPWASEPPIVLQANAAVPPVFQQFAAEYRIVAVESVSLPAGNFANCLKVYRSSVVSAVPPITGSVLRVEWYCPGLGQVKVIDASAGVFELTSVVQ